MFFDGAFDGDPYDIGCTSEAFRMDKPFRVWPTGAAAGNVAAAITPGIAAMNGHAATALEELNCGVQIVPSPYPSQCGAASRVRNRMDSLLENY